MPNIQNILTKEEKIFIKSKGLDISDFFDGQGIGGQVPLCDEDRPVHQPDSG